MSYAEKNLAPGETIVYRARYHWIYYRLTFALLLVAAVFGLWWWIAGNRLEDGTTSAVFGNLALLFLLAAAAHFAVRRVRSSADEYVVTNRRVIRKYGLVVLHGVADPVVPVELSRGLAARYPRVDLRELDCGHFEVIDPCSAVWPAVRDALTGG